MEPVWIIVTSAWLGAAVLTGWIGRREGYGFWGPFLVACLLLPLFVSVFVSVAIVAAIALIWLAAALLSGRLARAKGASFEKGFVLSLAGSPVLALLWIYGRRATGRGNSPFTSHGADHSTSSGADPAETLSWEKVRSSLDPDDYRAFLAQSQAPELMQTARNRIGILGRWRSLSPDDTAGREEVLRSDDIFFELDRRILSELNEIRSLSAEQDGADGSAGAQSDVESGASPTPSAPSESMTSPFAADAVRSAAAPMKETGNYWQSPIPAASRGEGNLGRRIMVWVLLSPVAIALAVYLVLAAVAVIAAGDTRRNGIPSLDQIPDQVKLDLDGPSISVSEAHVGVTQGGDAEASRKRLADASGAVVRDPSDPESACAANLLEMRTFWRDMDGAVQTPEFGYFDGAASDIRGLASLKTRPATPAEAERLLGPHCKDSNNDWALKVSDVTDLDLGSDVGHVGIFSPVMVDLPDKRSVLLAGAYGGVCHGCKAVTVGAVDGSGMSLTALEGGNEHGQMAELAVPVDQPQGAFHIWQIGGFYGMGEYYQSACIADISRPQPASLGCLPIYHSLAPIYPSFSPSAATLYEYQKENSLTHFSYTDGMEGELILYWTEGVEEMGEWIKKDRKTIYRLVDGKYHEWAGDGERF